ncbi:MAG: hypothetical protein HZA54_10065 [Planctomycetes bacterium]|nr:hypothetical protein [Planctomycetota bacterium]
MSAPYELIIGLEVHVQLATRTKLFCACLATHADGPADANRQACPICLGYPGALPRVNQGAVDLALAAVEALGCDCATELRFDRKHYFYADLPKNFQITQFHVPLGRGSALKLQPAARGEPTEGAGGAGFAPAGCGARIRRIHMEEDAARLKHAAGASELDFNRCGIPLIEIVTEPDLRSARAAESFLRWVQGVLRFLGVSRARFELGEMRCDVNFSLRPTAGPGGTARRPGLYPKMEIKNLNAASNVVKSLTEAAEFYRGELDGGRTPESRTWRWNEEREKLEDLREKAGTEEYSHMPEPDLPPQPVRSSEPISEAERSLPGQRALDAAYRRAVAEGRLFRVPAPAERAPEALVEHLAGRAGLTPAQVFQMVFLADRGAYLQGVLDLGGGAGSGPGTVLQNLRPEHWDAVVRAGTPSAVVPALARVIELVGTKQVPRERAYTEILGAAVAQGVDPLEIARTQGWLVAADTAAMAAHVRAVLAEKPALAEDLKRGRHGVEQAIVGAVMRRTRGACDGAQVQAEVAKLRAELRGELRGDAE